MVFASRLTRYAVARFTGFPGRAEYEEFLAGLFRRRNQLRRERVAAELKVLGELPKRRLAACTKEVQQGSRNATLNIRHNTYSVPSQLIEERWRS